MQRALDTRYANAKRLAYLTMPIVFLEGLLIGVLGFHTARDEQLCETYCDTIYMQTALLGVVWLFYVSVVRLHVPWVCCDFVLFVCMITLVFMDVTLALLNGAGIDHAIVRSPLLGWTLLFCFLLPVYLLFVLWWIALGQHAARERLLEEVPTSPEA